MNAAVRDRIIELAARGMPPREIEARTGVDRNVAYTAISWARRHGRHIPHFKGGPPTGANPRSRNIRIPAEHYATLTDEARLRGYRSAGALVAALLATIARDRLVGAIIDTEATP